MKMEQTEYYETSAREIQKQENYTTFRTQYSEHGDSLKSRNEQIPCWLNQLEA